ncbi:MAG: DNA polymerase III subunit gamma/tau [Clostridia bacterium]|nr:DNA polymerase III subunit gamma/tau [Clostridia bacterium]
MSEYRALYRKWRPPDFDDVCGQDSITDILKYEVSSGKLSHAYLFSGSRGTGKTTCAKILAKAVNCENPKGGNPCNKCEACRSIDAGIATDVIEMDAASNNGIGDVRDMQDEIAFTPAILKYRVYIIDEVHMMSTQAFNALLKTLEEPPSYVIFILATTEYHKLPTTIVSRCQRFDFKRIPNDIIISRLISLANAEKIEITEDAARVIARVSRGGMRDAISLLELCAGAHKPIDEALVFETVGSGNRENAFKLVRAIVGADYTTVYDIVDAIVMQSGDLSVFWQEIIDTYRDLMVVKNSSKAKAYLDLTDVEFSTLSELASEFSMAKLSYHVSLLEGAMADMQRAFNSKRSIAEIALTRMCDPRATVSIEALASRVEALEKELAMIKLGVPMAQATSVQGVDAKKKYAQEKPSQSSLSSPSSPAKPSTAVPPQAPKPHTTELKLYDRWGGVIERIGELKPSLSAGIATATVYKDGDCKIVIKLGAFFAGKLKSNETDMAIIRGVIAEMERKTAAEIEIVVEAQTRNNNSPFSEIEAAFK